MFDWATGVRRRFRLPRRGERGAAIPEFLMVSVMLVFVAMLIVQAVLYLYIRSIVVASAAEGARYAANANADPVRGAEVATDRIARGTSRGVADEIACEATGRPGEAGATEIQLQCAGDLPLFFVPLGDALPIDVRAGAAKEGG